MKTAIYARTQKFSPEIDKMEEQIAACMERAENEDVEIYKDYALGADVFRPELQRMMKDIRACKIQRVIVQDVARLSRSYMHLTQLIREMGECGCTILSLTEDIDTGRNYDGSEELCKMINVWERRQRMHEMEDSGRYRFYGEKIDDIPDDQVEDRYMQMVNFLSDARTHDF